jgi:hypothetical protein
MTIFVCIVRVAIRIVNPGRLSYTIETREKCGLSLLDEVFNLFLRDRCIFGHDDRGWIAIDFEALRAVRCGARLRLCDHVQRDHGAYGVYGRVIGLPVHLRTSAQDTLPPTPWITSSMMQLLESSGWALILTGSPILMDISIIRIPFLNTRRKSVCSRGSPGLFVVSERAYQVIPLHRLLSVVVVLLE